MAVAPEVIETIQSANVARNRVYTIEVMTDEELESLITAQILATETLHKAFADQQEGLHGPSVMVLMPGETVPRFLDEPCLTSVAGEHPAAASALSALGSVGAGETIVIAQGWSFQMVAFTYTWSA